MNASLAGVVEESRLWPDVRALYGAQHGIDGVLAEKFFDLGAQPEALIAAIALTPGSALGSSRSPATPGRLPAPARDSRQTRHPLSLLQRR